PPTRPLPLAYLRQLRRLPAAVKNGVAQSCVLGTAQTSLGRDDGEGVAAEAGPAGPCGRAPPSSGWFKAALQKVGARQTSVRARGPVGTTRKRPSFFRADLLSLDFRGHRVVRRALRAPATTRRRSG